VVGRGVFDSKAGIVPILDQHAIEVPEHVAAAPDQTVVIGMILLPFKGADHGILKGVRIILIPAVEGGHIEAQFHPLPFVEVAGGIAVDMDHGLVGIVPLHRAVPAAVFVAIVHPEEGIVDIVGAGHRLAIAVVADIGKDLIGGVDAFHLELDLAGGAARNFVFDEIKGGLGDPAVGGQLAAALCPLGRSLEGIFEFQNLVDRLRSGCERPDQGERNQDAGPFVAKRHDTSSHSTPG